jgi:RNA polymerase sporulation-specific sigma factor
VNQPDVILVRLAKAGDIDAMGELVLRYQRFSQVIANRFYFAGADRSDVEQEALIAITVAVRSYRGDAGVPFSAFASLCINRWLATAVVRSRRQKHRALNEASRRATDEDGDSFALAERIPDHRAGPDDLAITRERLRETLARFETLSPLERAAIIGVANGVSYKEIGERFGPKKTIDNAVQRARKKLAA